MTVLHFLDYKALLDPMALALAAAALLLARFTARGPAAPSKRARRARTAAWIGLAFVYAFSCPLLVNLFVRVVETKSPPLTTAIHDDGDRTALVVLSGGARAVHAGTPPSEWLSSATTGRVMAAARIYREHPFPIIVLSGGPKWESSGMLDLALRLGLPRDRIVMEPMSANTHENATMTGALLRERSIDRAVVVTSAMHMRRALRYFEMEGVRATGATADVIGYTMDGIRLSAVVPSASAMLRSHVAMHEVVGWMALLLGH